MKKCKKIVLVKHAYTISEVSYLTGRSYNSLYNAISQNRIRLIGNFDGKMIPADEVKILIQTSKHRLNIEVELNNPDEIAEICYY